MSRKNSLYYTQSNYIWDYYGDLAFNVKNVSSQCAEQTETECFPSFRNSTNSNNFNNQVLASWWACEISHNDENFSSLKEKIYIISWVLGRNLKILVEYG